VLLSFALRARRHVICRACSFRGRTEQAGSIRPIPTAEIEALVVKTVREHLKFGPEVGRPQHHQRPRCARCPRGPWRRTLDRYTPSLARSPLGQPVPSPPIHTRASRQNPRRMGPFVGCCLVSVSRIAPVGRQFDRLSPRGHFRYLVLAECAWSRLPPKREADITGARRQV
jgi:hypothetical protein